MSDDAPAMDQPEIHECHHCGEPTPAGTFCGHCGGHLVDTAPSAGHRRFAYAAAPHEPVSRPALISTLFPHLPHRHSHIFRDLVSAGVVAVVILAALHLYVSATVTAALVLPVLYLFYLYEVEVYEHEPIAVLALTFVAGAVLGLGFAWLNRRLATTSLTPTAGALLLSGVVLPVIAQVLMVAGPLTLIGRRHFDEVLDGLSFGAASALGFTMTVIVAGYWQTFTTVSVPGLPADDLLRLVRVGILGAIVNASTTALITASLWLRRHGRSRNRHQAAWRGAAAAVVAAFAAQVVLAVLTVLIGGLAGQIVIWAIGAAALLVAVRVVIHHALLDEGAEHEIGPPSACPECHRLVPTMRFCPACGVSRSAAPKRRDAQARTEPAAT